MDTYPTNGNDVGSVIPPNEKEVAVLLTSISTTEMETTSTTTTTTTTTTVATTTLPPSKIFLFFYFFILIENLWKTNFLFKGFCIVQRQYQSDQYIAEGQSQRVSDFSFDDMVRINFTLVRFCWTIESVASYVRVAKVLTH